jgi:hypothetical protein
VRLSIYLSLVVGTAACGEVKELAVDADPNTSGDAANVDAATIFDAPPGTARLSITLGGGGIGNVTSVPAGIDCGVDCLEDYAVGTQVELAAGMDAGSTFAGWTGGGCSGTGTCTVDVSADVAITAGFDCTPGSMTFGFTGGPQSLSLPSCVTTLIVDVRGAAGGGAFFSPNPIGAGGRGGRLQASIPVTTGDTYTVFVGGAGGNASSAPGAPGFGGGGGGGSEAPSGQWGGGGGGASDIRRNGSSLADRIAVAGGGGGAAACGGLAFDGGAGGDVVGGSPPAICSGTTTAPTGGSQVAGGIGGSYTGWCTAANGALGDGSPGCSPAGSGGGAGGYFGGGGGAWNGGGGGSSFAVAGASAVTHTQGFQMGSGVVIASW